MPASDKKASPFSMKTSAAGKLRAFKVVVFLALFSFFCMVAGIYVDFIKAPEISAVYYPAQTDQMPYQESLIVPQPPQKKLASEAEDEKKLIQRLEKEQENFKQTAEAFREIVENTHEITETSQAQEPVLPESNELIELQREQDAAKQNKLNEIEALNAERLAAKDETFEQKPDLITPSVLQEEQDNNNQKGKQPAGLVAPPSSAQKIKKSDKNFFAIPTAKKNDLPQPDLVQTNLMASLPDFSQIKKEAASNSVPLPVIDPLPELQEESRYGKQPVEKNGRTPFSAYRKPQTAQIETPYVAILVSGLGKRENTTQAAIAALPDVVSLSFSPYTNKLKNYITDARKAGHETLIDLPMQQGAFPETDPGPLGLVSGLPEQENRKRLRKILGQDVAFIGLSAAANENFSYSGTQMKPFLDEIIRRGLIYIDGTDNPRMPLYAKALRPDIYIADEFYRSAIRTRLEKTRKTALEKGHAFIRVEAVPITLLTVAEWMKTFVPTEQMPVPELSFVPLSYYVSQKKEKK